MKTFSKAILYNILFWTLIIAAFVLSTNVFYTAATSLVQQPHLTRAAATKNPADILSIEPSMTRTRILFLSALTLFLFLFFCAFFTYAIMIQQFVQKQKHTYTSALRFASKNILFFIPFAGSFFIGNTLLPTALLILTLSTLLILLPSLAITTLTPISFIHALTRFFQVTPSYFLLLIPLFILAILFLSFLPLPLSLTLLFFLFIVWNTSFHQTYTTHTCAHK